MAMFPLLFEVGVHSYVSSSDGIDTYSPAADAAGTVCKVYGWAPAGDDGEPPMAGHDRVIVDLNLYVPSDFTAGPYDLIDIEGDQYQVIGEPADLTRGPFNFAPGIVLHLRKVSG